VVGCNGILYLRAISKYSYRISMFEPIEEDLRVSVEDGGDVFYG
jgi:hypothetical protein